MYRILLAEDDRDNQAIYFRMLKKAGYEIDIAENGAEAAEAAGKTVYDLILMDIQMPEMNGMEAAKIIRTLQDCHSVPIVAFTSLSPSGNRQKCLDAGMTDFLPKPCSEDELLECLDVWLRYNRAILIVDDMAESRRLLEHHLGKTHYALLYAKNGIEAIAAFKKNSNIALILMDMEMPVMDGYTAARAIDALMGSRKIPIIALTAHEGEKEVERCLRAGCSGYLHKPVVEEMLFYILKGHLADFDSSAVPPGAIKTGTENVVLVDPDLIELVPGYLKNRKLDIDEITRLLDAGDLAAIRIIGHSMAGSAGGYGIPEIGRIGKAIENAALAGKPAEIKELNQELSGYLLSVTVAEKKS